jgi:flagellar hook assembly protein FlgD
MVRLKDKESRLSFSTDAVLNEAAQSVGAVEVAAIPATFALDQNYPNPFNPSTTVRYQIPNDANVALDIYNLQGQKIRTLVSKEQKAGYYSVVWDGRNEAGQTVSSGLYLYRVQAGSFVATHKMLMIK